MASDLLSIAKSGAKASRIALDVTAQNIANASSEGYVRRTVRLEEVSAAGGIGRIGDVSLSGVRVDQVIRNADLFRQAEVRRTGADLSRANAEVSGLSAVESAIEQTGVFNSIVEFEGALQQLAVDPTDAALRASVIETTRTMSRTFNIAATSLDTAGEGIRFEAADDVDQVNLLAQELSRVNLRLARAADASSDQTSLLDQRDSLLQQLSQRVDVSATFAPDFTVDVRIGGSAGPLLVDGGTAGTMAMATAGDGTISFTLDGNPVTPLSGALVGRGQALVKLADTRSQLDALADGIIATVNASQASGAALDGSPGLAMLSGSGAAGIALAFEQGALIATAPAGSGPNSRDLGNLAALRTALAANDASGTMDALLFDVSATVRGRTITRNTLEVIAGNARIALAAQAGVDLDQEAINLVRFQQAFQASGRVMQVASDLFDTLLGIR